MKTKKYLIGSILLALCIAATASLTGCNESSAAAETTATSEDTTVEAAEEEPENDSATEALEGATSDDEKKDDKQPPDGEKPSGEKPDGEAPSGDKPDGEPPEKPDGEAPSGEKPDGENGESGGFGGNGGASSDKSNGTAANTISESATVSETTYTSSGDDENALRVDGASATLTDVTFEKNSGDSSNTESGDFYGMNAAFLAENGASVTINGAKADTSVVNGNAIFAYGEGTTVTVNDAVISTTERSSGGLMTTGGAKLSATDCTVETFGESSAAIRSDRGGGDVSVTGGSYTTNGTGSPAIYSTANISATSANLTSNASEALIVEGENSIALTDCTVVGNKTGTNKSGRDRSCNVMIYQSMSGDADEGTASFSMTGGSLTSKSGDMFYVTNTSCEIYLTNVEMTYENDYFLSVEGNSNGSWGKEGSNGGTVKLVTKNQKIDGAITVDDISKLDINLKEKSAFTGSINQSGQAGEVNVTLDESSTWTLTADSYVTSFTGGASQLNANGFTLYVNGVAFN